MKRFTLSVCVCVCVCLSGCCLVSGSAKRKRVMNEDDLRIPLEMGYV